MLKAKPSLLAMSHKLSKLKPKKSLVDILLILWKKLIQALKQIPLRSPPPNLCLSISNALRGYMDLAEQVPIQCPDGLLDRT